MKRFQIRFIRFPCRFSDAAVAQPVDLLFVDIVCDILFVLRQRVDLFQRIDGVRERIHVGRDERIDILFKIFHPKFCARFHVQIIIPRFLGKV